MTKPEYSTMITISTAHISPETDAALQESLSGPSAPGLTAITAYPKIVNQTERVGWFLYPNLPIEQIERSILSEDMAAILDFASFCNATMICLDCDAPVIDSLPKFEY